MYLFFFSFPTFFLFFCCRVFSLEFLGSRGFLLRLVSASSRWLSDEIQLRLICKISLSSCIIDMWMSFLGSGKFNKQLSDS